jgi:hypothetical protein
MEKVERYKESPRRAVSKKIEYTDEQVLESTIKIALAKTLTDINELREVWTTNTAYLDIPADGTTLKDVINSRVKELSE